MTWGSRNFLSYIQFLQNEILLNLTQTEGMKTPQSQQGAEWLLCPVLQEVWGNGGEMRLVAKRHGYQKGT